MRYLMIIFSLFASGSALALECHDGIGSTISIDLENLREGELSAPLRKVILAGFVVTGPAARRFGEFQLFESADTYMGSVEIVDRFHFVWQPVTARSFYRFDLYLTEQEELMVMGDREMWRFNQGCVR